MGYREGEGEEEEEEEGKGKGNICFLSGLTDSNSA